MLRPIRDRLGLKVVGIYCVPYECSKVCVRQTGKLIETQCKEHMRCIHLGQSEKSIVVEHRFETVHNIDFDNAAILDKDTVCMNHMIKEAIDIMFPPDNFIRDLGFTLSWPWHLVTSMIKKYTDARIQRQAKSK
jgi:hypothetical protein